MHDDTPLRTSWRRVLGRAGSYTLLAAVIYVLSVGPAFYLLIARSKSIDRAVMTAYAPVLWLYTSTGLRPWFAAYDTWWCSLPGGPLERYNMQRTP